MLTTSPQQYDPIFDRHNDTWVFDLDNTLYAAECNLFKQIDQKIGSYVQKVLGLPPEEARVIQKGYLLQYGTTLKGLMDNHSVDVDHYLDSVHDIDFSPVKRDEKLRAAIQKLEGRKLVFTNASAPYSVEILQRLGIEDLFEDVFDIIAAELLPKPMTEVYDKFIKDHAVDPNRSVMFEDMVRNLKPAHDLGMGTVWINTGDEWGKANYDASTVHAEAPNLSDWLHDFTIRK
ncbi:MAG: pyrimidine 5'-nucleotidase [Kordiimonadaceae bacterium]|nr:pyrimidine 5'-nucleotidase [Kordiimonadaceae bacterium]